MIRARRIVTVYGERYRPGQEIPEASWSAVRKRNQSAMMGLGIVERVEPVNPLAPPSQPFHCKVQGCGREFGSVQAYGGHMRSHQRLGDIPPKKKRKKRIKH